MNLFQNQDIVLNVARGLNIEILDASGILDACNN